MISRSEHSDTIGLKTSIARVLLVALGALGLWLAWIADLSFVEQSILGRPVGDVAMAAVLADARILLAVAGAGLILLAGVLPRLLGSSFTRRLLSSQRALRGLVFALPFVALALVAAWKAACGIENPLYLLLVREDSVFEYLTALLYFIGFGLALVLARRLQRDGQRWPGLMFAGLAFLFLFVALEEVSYGQRIFGLATPEAMAEHNLQQEISIHNLAALEPVFFRIGPMLIGLAAAFAWLLLGFRNRLPPPLPDLLLYGIPPWFATGYFLLYALYWAAFSLLGGHPWLIWQDQELLEFVLAGGFLALVVNGLTLQRGQAARHRHPAG